jgi:hypothetical protein
VAGRVAAEAPDAASEAGDNWPWAGRCRVTALVTSARGYDRGAAATDRALAVTGSDPTLTDLRLLQQLNKAVTLGNLDRHRRR